MNRCARCNWRPENDETLEEHAEATNHPLCTACSTSLPPDRPRICRDCQDQTATHLADILTMWTELPDLLEAHASARLPGGDALVLAGPGSRGPQDVDDPTRPEVYWLISDNRHADTPSVAWTLTSWEDDWRHVRQEPASQLPPTAADRVVTAAAEYLREHGPWAAAEHWAWSEYAADLTRLHGALLRVTGRYRAPTRLGLSCFACRGPLQYRVVRDEDDRPPARPRWWLDKGVAGPVDEAEFTRRSLGRAGLEEEHATCRDCGATYDPTRLLLAQRDALEQAQWLEDEDGTRWGTVKAVAGHVERSEWTLRAWRSQGVIRSSEHGGAIYLHLADVEAEVELRAPRRSRREERSA